MHIDLEFEKAAIACNKKHNMTIKFNVTSAGEHVPRVKRNNRVTKERIRAAYYQLPYQHLPRTLLIHLVMGATRKLNYFPARYGVSKYYSPRMILHHQNLDFEHDCSFVTGEYVQGNNEVKKTNNQEARTLDCLHLRPLNNHQGSYSLLHS